MQNIRENNNLISLVRGTAIILVVLGHAITPSIREKSMLLFYFWNGVYSFHMFLYFFISGYLFQGKLEKYKKDKRSFLIKKAKLLLVPYITLTFLEYGLVLLKKFELGAKILSVLGLQQVSLMDFLKALLLNNGHYDTHLWFIYALFFVFVINIIIPKFSSGIGYLIFLLFCSALYPILGKIIIPIKTILYWSVPFWIGRRWFAGDWLKRNIDRSGKQIAEISVLFVILNVLLNAMDGLSGKLPTILAYARVGLGYEIKHVTGILGMMVVFWLINRVKNTKIKKCLQRLDDYSYDIYILHQPFLTVGIATFLLKGGFNIYIVAFLSTICGLILSAWASEWVIRKSKWLSLLVLGSH